MSISNHLSGAEFRVPPSRPILVVASPRHALELLRWATLKSDDVLFVAAEFDPVAQAFASRYAVDVRQRVPQDGDLAGASALLLSLEDRDAENALIRRARALGVAVHVRDRPLVSDFTILAMMEQPWPARRAA
jgi:hypothetical protein